MLPHAVQDNADYLEPATKMVNLQNTFINTFLEDLKARLACNPSAASSTSHGQLLSNISRGLGHELTSQCVG